MPMGSFRFRTRSLEAFVLLAALCVAECACESPVAQSHIDANVPGANSFDSLMERDLSAYFEQTLGTNGEIHVDYRLLREGSTQTGISYPKFYVWAKILSGSRILTEGAVRVEAVDRTQFTVTHFLSKDQIATDPDKIDAIFPAALKAKILALAAAK